MGAFLKGTNTANQKNLMNSLSSTIDAKAKALEDRLPKMLPKGKHWDHPLYDDQKGGMVQSPSNGILSLFDIDRQRQRGTHYNARKVELDNMGIRRDKMSQKQF